MVISPVQGVVATSLVGAVTAATQPVNEDESVVENIVHGALGMDPPQEIESSDSFTYKAGQYLKGAATIGSIIALAV